MFPELGMPFDVMRRVRLTAADQDFSHAVDAAANEWFGGNGWRLQSVIEPPAPEEEREAA